MKQPSRSWSVFAVVASLIAVLPVPAPAAKTAFRISDMDWRDPHMFVNFIGCRDITDTLLGGFAFNPYLQTLIQTDGDSDGMLDLSYLIIFDPLDQSAGGGTATFAMSECTAPMAGTTCDSLINPIVGTYTNMASTCLSTIAGTTHPYTPAVVSTSAPCFVLPLGTLSGFDVGFTHLTLYDAYLAGTYVGSPATQVVNGLIRGFITEADADATIIPSSFALIGGLPLSELFAGGTGNCAAYSDKDIGPAGQSGWYVYFNFVATQVTYTEAPTPVRGTLPLTIDLAEPFPNPFNPSTRMRYTLSSPGYVRVTVFDVNGSMVRRLVDRDESAGAHDVTWDGMDSHGRPASSGLYFARLESNGESRTRKMVLLK